MAPHHFDCPYCGEKLRFGSAACDTCGRPAPDWNRRGGYRALLVIAGGIAGLMAALWLWLSGGD